MGDGERGGDGPNMKTFIRQNFVLYYLYYLILKWFWKDEIFTQLSLV